MPRQDSFILASQESDLLIQVTVLAGIQISIPAENDCSQCEISALPLYHTPSQPTMQSQTVWMWINMSVRAQPDCLHFHWPKSLFSHWLPAYYQPNYFHQFYQAKEMPWNTDSVSDWFIINTVKECQCSAFSCPSAVIASSFSRPTMQFSLKSWKLSCLHWLSIPHMFAYGW